MLIALETIANALGRPFGLDFYFERTRGFTKRTFPRWAVERPTDALDSYKLFAGPLEFHMCVMTKARAGR